MPAGRPAGQDRTAAKIERDERRRAATKLAVAGHTYEEIAERLGYSSRQAAHRDVKAGLAPALKALTEAGKEYIAVSLARLEEAHRVAAQVMTEHRPATLDEPDAMTADQRLAAVTTVVKVSESLRKLLGIDAPTKTETTIDATVGYAVAVAPEELEQL